MLYIWYVAVTCLPISVWDGVLSETKDSTYGVLANYTCDDNRTFPDGTNWKTAQCMADGNWSPEVVACPGMEILIILWSFKMSNIMEYLS